MNRGLLRTFTGIAATGAVMAGLSSATILAADTANLPVQADVTNNCTIGTTQLNFGAYDPVVANKTVELTGTGQILIACTKGATAKVSLGNGGGGSANARRLASTTGDNLPYQLYRPDNQVWSADGGALNYTSISMVEKTFPVLGKIAPGLDVAAGNYSDTIVATFNF
jgi:spore coat protein U-like protein